MAHIKDTIDINVDPHQRVDQMGHTALTHLDGKDSHARPLLNFTSALNTIILLTPVHLLPQMQKAGRAHQEGTHSHKLLACYPPLELRSHEMFAHTILSIQHSISSMLGLNRKRAVFVEFCMC